MQIVKSNRFDKELEDILEFIAKDNLTEALKFHDELIFTIKNMTTFPYMYRQSLKSEDVNVRDLIFKKYVIPYKIKKDEMLILGIFAQNRWKIK